MPKTVAAPVLCLILVACGGGSPSLSVTGPSSNLLKIGEVTIFNATFKDASGTNITKNFTWTSSAPSIAEVDQTGQVTTKRLGKVTIGASADGLTGSSAVQTTYGLEVVGGTSDTRSFGGQLTLAALFRFRSPTPEAVAPKTPFTMTFSGPSSWNGGASVNSGPWLMGTGGVSYWTQPLVRNPVQTGEYQVSTTINGVTYTSGFRVDATQVLALVSNIAQQNASSSSVAASWNAAPGAVFYQMLVGDAAGYKGTASSTSGTDATITGLNLDTSKTHEVYVIGMNFKYDAGFDMPAPAQFNTSNNHKVIAF